MTLSSTKPTHTNGSTSGYTITYNANGGSGAPGNQTSGNRTITYSFVNWKATNGTTYNPGASYAAEASTTMTAQWSSSTSSNSSWTCSNTVPSRVGYNFLGWSTSSTATSTTYTAGSTYTITSNLTLYAVWGTNSYTITISHLCNGFKNGEGNNSNGYAYLLGKTTINANYGTSVTIDSSLAKQIPNGCYLDSSFGSNNISSDGSWTNYTMPYSFTIGSDCSIEFYYNLNNYSITYEMNGGTNSSSNPTSYNVLYGVSLSEPTREEYKFDGWYCNYEKVTGINEGKNATFSSADDLYKQLSTRTTGDLTLTAKWKPQGLVYISNGTTWKKYQIFISDGTTWKQYMPYISDGTTWKLYS